MLLTGSPPLNGIIERYFEDFRKAEVIVPSIDDGLHGVPAHDRTATTRSRRQESPEARVSHRRRLDAQAARSFSARGRSA